MQQPLKLVLENLLLVRAGRQAQLELIVDVPLRVDPERLTLLLSHLEVLLLQDELVARRSLLGRLASLELQIALAVEEALVLLDTL